MKTEELALVGEHERSAALEGRLFRAGRRTTCLLVHSARRQRQRRTRSSPGSYSSSRIVSLEGTATPAGDRHQHREEQLGNQVGEQVKRRRR
jgi:hypothetical protein